MGRELQIDRKPMAIRQVDDRHGSCNPIDRHKLASRLRYHDLFGKKTSVERAHHSIAVPFNDGDNRGIAARDEDVARHGAKMRFDLRGLRAGLAEQNSSYHDDGASKRPNSGASSSPNK